MLGGLLVAALLTFAAYVLFFDEDVGLRGSGSLGESILMVATSLLIMAAIVGKLG